MLKGKKSLDGHDSEKKLTYLFYYLPKTEPKCWNNWEKVKSSLDASGSMIQLGAANQMEKRFCQISFPEHSGVF